MSGNLLEYYDQIQEILSNDVFQDYGVLGLFFNSLLSATALPLPTEFLTSALLLGGENQIFVIFALITGSSIGGIINYFIGFGGNKLFKKIKHEKKQKNIEDEKKSNKILDKFGWAAIFFASWIPVLGDLILISAGAKKINFKKFSVVMLSGKIIKSIVTVVGLGIIF